MAWEFKAGGGEEVFYKRLEDLVMKYQNDEVRVDVVFGMQELIDKYLGGEEAAAAAMRRRDKEVELTLAPGNIRADNEHEFFDDGKTATA
jgi:hypothetical protein